MYLALVMFGIGFLLIANSFLILLYALTAVILTFLLVFSEEYYLGKKFPEYKKYKKQTGMLLPRFIKQTK